MRHLSDAWSRRGEPNVLLVRYEDLSADLEGQMRRLAGHLGRSRCATTGRRLPDRPDHAAFRAFLAPVITGLA